MAVRLVDWISESSLNVAGRLIEGRPCRLGSYTKRKGRLGGGLEMGNRRLAYSSDRAPTRSHGITNQSPLLISARPPWSY